MKTYRGKYGMWRINTNNQVEFRSNEHLPWIVMGPKYPLSVLLEWIAEGTVTAE